MLASIPSPPSNVIELGPISLRAYGLMIALGVIAAVLVSQKRWTARGGDPDDIDDLDLDLDCGGGDAYQNTLQDDLDEELAADAKLPAGVLSETGFAVYKGYLFISQDVQFLEELLQRAANSTKSLVGSSFLL